MLAPLIEFAELISTGPFGSMLHKSDYVSDGVPLINPINIVDGMIRPDSQKQVGPEAVSRLSSYVLKAGDLVVGRRGEIGRCAVVEPAQVGWVCGTGCFFIRPRATTDARFLAHLLRSPDYRARLEQESTGATMKNMSNTTLAQLPVSIPCLEEQRRIVTLLDEAFEGIATAKAHAEQNLQSAMDVLTQHLLSVFAASSGNAVPVASLARCSLGKMLDKAKNRGELKPYLRNLNVRWFGFDLDNLLEMRFTEDEAEKYTVRKGDLVICEGGYPGRCAMWDQDHPIYIQKALHRVRFLEPAHARWVQYYLYAQDISGGLRQHFTGSGIQHFTGASLAKLMVPLPELHVLRKHVELFDQLRADCERLRTVYQRKLTALDELKQSLLHQAFTGQL